MKLGVIGGLGPIATAYFLELIIKMTKAQCDGDHLEMVIYNCPSIPDRTDYILGKCKASPIVPIMNIGKQLVEQKVDYIAIPCITAHCFYDSLIKEIKVPIINMVRETALYLKENKISKVGILATDGTISSKIFEKELTVVGIKVVLPSKKSQQAVMDLIYKDIKAGKTADMSKFTFASKELRENGAEVIVLGCTELSLIKRDYPIGPDYIDVLEVLAKACILACEKSLKGEYKYLEAK